MKYPTVFHLVSAVSQDTGVSFVLIGGFAVNHYKVTRQTADIDFLITENDFKRILNLLEKEGYKEDYRQKVFSRLITDSDYLVDLDFMFVDEGTLSKIIKEGSQIEIAKQKFIVPSLNHLIALKLHSIKNNPKLRMENLKFPIIKGVTPKAKRLSMNDYVKFVFLHLRYTLNKKEYKKAKRISAVTAPFSLR